MKIADIISFLASVAPPSLQENYDNAGLLTGAAAWECSGALISLDATEAVVREAIDKKCNLVIAHHPIIFGGLKKINGKNYVEQTVIAAIKNDIAIYAIHTNLDNIITGVNGIVAAKLGLTDTHILAPKAGLLRKLQVFVPVQASDGVRRAIFTAGAGQVGQYSECSFNSAGTGTFTAGAGTHPFTGEIGRQQQENEVKIETIFPAWLEPVIVSAMKVAHPYEEVAYDILPLTNTHGGIGAGIVGLLPEAMEEGAFLSRLKSVFGVPVIRHTALGKRRVKKVALCGGAGSSLISNAIAVGADFYITADMKYHEFFDANGRLVIADIGHFESEQFTMELLAGFLREKFPTFAALKTGVNTNPVHYFL